jgi:hypothetical protein
MKEEEENMCVCACVWAAVRMGTGVRRSRRSCPTRQFRVGTISDGKGECFAHETVINLSPPPLCHTYRVACVCVCVVDAHATKARAEHVRLPRGVAVRQACIGRRSMVDAYRTFKVKGVLERRTWSIRFCFHAVSSRLCFVFPWLQICVSLRRRGQTCTTTKTVVTVLSGLRPT